MADKSIVTTAIGQPLPTGEHEKADLARIKIGQAPVIFQTQSFGHVPLERPEELRQWEEDLRTYYGITVDASALAGRACETCSCCTDDCGMME